MRNFILAIFPVLHKDKHWKSHQQAGPYGTDSLVLRQKRIEKDRGVQRNTLALPKRLGEKQIIWDPQL